MRSFRGNCTAVLDLPMRLTVALIIGAVALTAILGFILNPCLLPKKMVVSVTPMAAQFTTTDAGPESFLFTVTVTESSGRPITGASVIIKGLHSVINGETGTNGKITLTIDNIRLEPGVYEGYLDVQVKAPCFDTFSQSDMIKIIRKPPSP
ncbi:MAG: carboxypeptidase-like regulatory domain-containing protein [Candidatus Thermoplasmatota archaeon]